MERYFDSEPDIVPVEEGEPGQDSAELAGVLEGLGEEFGFDSETCAEIAGMPFAEAYETAYSYLTSAGLDADTILQRFTE